jgi:DNA polymerase III delta prime subunit
MTLEIHKEIKEKLKYFYEIHKIPNIIFHGPSGSGKSTIVNEFINLIYNNNVNSIKDFVMYVNCAHGKGIKFIREELKFFAKSNINSNNGDIFKSIILINADKLTMDAQSALRRCIELFSHTTRFFIIVEDKYKLLKPILSRFCEIYIPEPEIGIKQINLYKYNLIETFNMKEIRNQKTDWLKKELSKNMNKDITCKDLLDFVFKLYEKGYSALDIIKLIEDHLFYPQFNIEKRYEMLRAFNKIKKEIRNEKLLMFFVLNFIYVDSNENITNISFM